MTSKAPLRRFGRREIREARAYAAAGGQALHVWTPSEGERAAFSARGLAAPFRRARVWAHLLDQDRERLVATARRLGVRVVRVGRPGTPHQHVDLCAGPLDRALAECS